LSFTRDGFDLIALNIERIGIIANIYPGRIVDIE